MFSASLRAVRPAALRVTRSRHINAVRALSSTSAARSDHHAPALFGPGATPGEVPTDEQQATGIERFQLLAEMQGVDAFDKEPLDSSRVGTFADPIKVFSLVRLLRLLRWMRRRQIIIGCRATRGLHGFSCRLA